VVVQAQDLTQRARRLASKAKSAVENRIAAPQAMQLTNVENSALYSFELPFQRMVPGVSAMLRAKNEAANVPVVLPEILGLFDEVVFIDNASTDATVAEVARIAVEHEHGDRIKIVSYPFSIARCGDEHWATPEDSVHNLAYYYNWCLSQCSFDYVFKWDLDMVPIPGQSGALSGAFSKIDHQAAELWSVRCQTIYKSPQGDWYAANDEVNKEPRLHPNSANVRYRKARMWEALQPDIQLVDREVHTPCIYELKDTSVDEFDHWTNTIDLSPRKQTEYANYCAVRDGCVDPAAFTLLPSTDLPSSLR